jgi:hypothetical protein
MSTERSTGRVENFLPVALAAQSLVDVPLQETFQQRFQLFTKRIGKFDVLKRIKI